MLVGRESELSSVEELLDSIMGGFAALALEGEPGIGKTTVWREAVRRAQGRGYQVLVSRPAQAEAKFSFAGLTDLLEPVPPAALEALPEPQRHALEQALLRAADEGVPPEPRTVAAGLRGVLIELARASPVLVAIDDVQWLDSASAGALVFALRRLDQQRVGALSTRRIEGRSTHDRFELPSARRVELGRLSLAAIHEMLKRRLDRSLPRSLLVRVYQGCGGNPFFALVLAREVVEAGIGPTDPLPVPGDLRRLVRRRLGRLSAAAREALLVAAAVGEPTREVLVAALDGDPSEALEEAENADVLELDGASIRFAHPLYAAAIYAATSDDRRRQLHRRLSLIVTNPEERARHLALAAEAPSEEVAAVLEDAALRALGRGAAGSAAGLFAESSRLTPSDDVRAGQRRMLQAAEAHFESADTGAARALLERLVSEMPPGADRARALLVMAIVHNYEDGPVPAKEDCLLAMDDAAQDLVLQAEANLRLSFVCNDDFAISQACTRRAVELVRAAPGAPDDLVACALIEDAYVRFLTGGGLDRAQVAEAERVLPAQGRSWSAVRAHSALYEWAKYTDDLVHARELLEQTRQRRLSLGDEYYAAVSEHHLAEVECWLGEWSRAGDYAASSGRVIEQAGNPLWRAVGLYDRALIAAHLGEVTQARDAALEGLALAEAAEDPWLSAGLLSVLGFLELSVDDFAAAEQWLSRADAMVQRIGLVEPARFRFHGDRIEAIVALGEVDRAREQVARLRQRAEVAPRPWVCAVCARSEALVDAASGKLDEALHAMEAALREHERLEMPFELARTLLSLGRVQRRRKQRKAAREALQQSLDIFERLGAALWADKARSELERTHVRQAPDQLTPSEEQVARLAAAGLRNREIADRLFLSPRTVEANLARSYRKLGIRSRAELSVAIGRVPPMSDS
jgi:DNA-binding CsgD family transcriptional regulator